jgi:hypothetical protein
MSNRPNLVSPEIVGTEVMSIRVAFATGPAYADLNTEEVTPHLVSVTPELKKRLRSETAGTNLIPVEPLTASPADLSSLALNQEYLACAYGSELETVVERGSPTLALPETVTTTFANAEGKPKLEAN